MSIDAKVRAIIENRKNNFYDFLDEFKEDGELCFPKSMEPDFDFEVGSDEEKIYNQKLGRFKALSARLQANAGLYYTDDESSQYFGCSYEEILGMANNGVNIPDEILNWAYAMAEANPTEPTETVEDNNDAQVLFNALKQNPSLNIKTITKIFVNKCVEQSDELESYLEELVPIEKEMEEARVEAETKKNEALNNIKNLTKEWNTLQNKLQSGTALSAEEKSRFEELQELFGQEDKKYQKTIDNTTQNFLKIGEKLSFFTGKAKTTFDFGTQTIEAASELAEFEKTHRTGKRCFFGGILGSSTNNIFGALGIIGSKRFSETANTVGINTQYFSTDVTTVIEEVQLLMQSTAETAGFDINDPSHTVESLTTDESLDEPAVQTTSETTPPASDGLSTDEENEAPVGAAPETDNVEETTTETDETEDVQASEETDAEQKTDEELLNNGEANLEEIDAKSLSIPGLKRLVKDEGVDTEKKGKEALKLVEELKAQSEVVATKETEVQEKTAEVNEASEENEETQNTDNNENDDMTEAQAGAEESKNELNAATENEALTIEGLRETFKASTKANTKYSKDVSISQDKMQESMRLSALTAAGGSTITGIGIYNIIQGNVILSTAWFNPFAAALGIYMINMGTSEIAIGNLMITGATALSLSATEGIEINEETTEKLGLSNENIANATQSLDEFEHEQMEEVENEDGTEESEETDTPQEPTEDDLRSQDEQLLADMNVQDTTVSELRGLVNADGKNSSKLGIENVKITKELEPQIPQITEEAIAIARAKRDEEAAQKNGNASTTASETPARAATTASSEAPAEADPETQEKETTDGIEELKAEKEEKETIFEQYRTDFQQDKAKNAAYSEDIKTTNNETSTGFNLGGQGTGAGTARTTLGLGEIATGTALLMNWWNPMAVKLGLELIKLGQADTALGGQLLGSGMSLTANSVVTLATNAIADEKVKESNKRTDDANEKVNEMEAEVNTAVEEQLKADEEEAQKAAEAQENSETGAVNNKDNKEEEELTPESAAEQEKNADEEAEDSEAQVKKDEKTIKKQAKEEKKEAKTVKKETKNAKKIGKEGEKAEKEGEDNEKLATEQQKLGEETAETSNQDEGQAEAEQTTTELTEANEISNEVTELAAEVQNDIAETQAATKAAEAENQSIVAEMTNLNSSLQQDQTQLDSIGKQIKQEDEKGNSSAPAQPAPAAQPQPQQAAPKKPAQAPKKAPKPEADETDNKPEQKPVQAAAPAKKPAQAPSQEPTVADAPAGSDKIQFASDKEKQPSLVGFVAQSDSLASGSVLANSQQNTPASQNNNTQGNGVGILALKNEQNKKKKAQQKKKQQEQKTQATGGTAAPQEEKQIIAANRTTEKPFDINSMAGGANGNANKSQGLRRSAEAVKTAAFNKQNRLREMAIRANNNVMQRIAEEARIQAEAARKQRLAQEKQERIQKIKQYAGIVQQVGGLTTAAGMIVEKCGTATATSGAAVVTAGVAQVTSGTTMVSTGSSIVATATAQLTTGGAEVATGTAMSATGATLLATGAAVTATGGTLTTTGTAMITTGTAMLSNPFTAAAGAALVASGTSLTTSGASMTASGATLTASGGTETATGSVQIGTGTALIGTGTASMAVGNSTISIGTGLITAGNAQIATGNATVASGMATIATGATIQTVGTIITAAGAATSAGADIANGNILGGITSIIGAAASVVGTAAPVSQLGNAAMQLGTQGAAVAQQLGAFQTNQNNGGQQQQNQKKKKQFKQNSRTEGIIAKTAQNKQAVGNRFNK